MPVEILRIQELRDSITSESDRNRKIQLLKNFLDKNNIRSLEEIGNQRRERVIVNKNIKIYSQDFIAIYNAFKSEEEKVQYLFPEQLSTLLIHLNFFNFEINDYDCKVILKRGNEGTHKSIFFFKLGNKNIRERNLEKFKQWYKKYFRETYIDKENGLKSLEEIRSKEKLDNNLNQREGENYTDLKTCEKYSSSVIYLRDFSGIYNILIGKRMSKTSLTDVSRLLIKLEIFNSEISDDDYEIILDRSSEPSFKSFYLYRLEDKNIRERNLEKFKQWYKKYFRETYIDKENGLKSLEEIGAGRYKYISNKHIKIGSCDFTGVYNILKKENKKMLDSKDLSLLLIELGIFNSKISDYDCEFILENKAKPAFSIYLSLLDDQDIKRENFKYFREWYKKYFRETYITKKKLISLEEIRSGNISIEVNQNRLSSNKFIGAYNILTGENKRNLTLREISILLIKLNLFSSKINDCDCEIILKRVSEGPYKSFYLSELEPKFKDRIISGIRNIFSFKKNREEEEILNFYHKRVLNNRKFFKTSKSWINFKKNNKRRIVNLVIKKYELEDEILRLSPSKLSAKWSNTRSFFEGRELDHEEILIRLIEEKEDIFLDVENNPDFYTSIFGRSIGAIKAKINLLIGTQKKEKNIISRGLEIEDRYSFNPLCFSNDLRLENEIVNNSIDYKNGIVNYRDREEKYKDTIFIISTQYSYNSIQSEEIIDVLIFSIEYKEKFEDLLDVHKEIIGQAYSKMFNSKEIVYPENFIKIRTSQEDVFLLGVGVRKRFSGIRGQFQAEYETTLNLENGEEKGVETLIFPY